MAGFFATHKGLKIAGIVLLLLIAIGVVGNLTKKKKPTTVATTPRTVAQAATTTPSTLPSPATRSTSAPSAPSTATTTPATTSLAGNLGVVLGGSDTAWRARFGIPDARGSTSQEDGFERCPSGNANAGVLQFRVTYDTHRSTVVVRNTCTPLSHDAGFAEAFAYLPRDARVQGPVTHQAAGEDDYVLVSASLGQAFPASMFSGCGGTSVVPGTIKLGVDDSGWTAILSVCVKGA